MQFEQIITAAVVASSGEIKYYDNVGIIILRGNIMQLNATCNINKNLGEFKSVEINNCNIRINLMDGDSLLFWSDPNKYYCNLRTITGLYINYFIKIGIIYRGQFIEMPIVKYLADVGGDSDSEYDTSEVAFYSENFEIIQQVKKPVTYMLPIKTFLDFGTFTVINDSLIKTGGFTRDGNFIYYGGEKYAFAFSCGNHYLHDATGKRGRTIFEDITEICYKYRIPKYLYPKFPGVDQCYYVYCFDGQYFGNAACEEKIGLYPRSENSGGRTKPAIRHVEGCE